MPWMMYMEEATTWITEFGINKGEKFFKKSPIRETSNSIYWGNQYYISLNQFLNAMTIPNYKYYSCIPINIVFGSMCMYPNHN